MPSVVELFPPAETIATAPADADLALILRASDGRIVRVPWSAVRSVETLRTVPASMVVAKTADYTVVANDSGTHFSNTGAAGSVNFTLPAVATSKGLRINIHVVADQQVAITAPAGTLVGPNNAGRTSYTTGASGQRIGQDIAVFCDGAKYYLMVDLKGLTAGTYA